VFLQGVEYGAIVPQCRDRILRIRSLKFADRVCQNQVVLLSASRPKSKSAHGALALSSQIQCNLYLELLIGGRHTETYHRVTNNSGDSRLNGSQFDHGNDSGSKPCTPFTKVFAVF
jgi:hypothetical protein